jgi:hypothetical protein
MRPFAYFVYLAVGAGATLLPSFVLQHGRSSAPSAFALVGPAMPEQQMTFRVALKSNNVSGLEARLAIISDPRSATYGQWLSAGASVIRVLPGCHSSDPCTCRRHHRPHEAIAEVHRGVQCLRQNQWTECNHCRRTRRMDVVHDQRLPRKLPLRRVFSAVPARIYSGLHHPNSVVLSAGRPRRPRGYGLPNDDLWHASGPAKVATYNWCLRKATPDDQLQHHTFSSTEDV